MRSGMARINEEPHSFTCHPHPRSGMSHTYLYSHPQSLIAVWPVLLRVGGGVRCTDQHQFLFTTAKYFHVIPLQAGTSNSPFSTGVYVPDSDRSLGTVEAWLWKCRPGCPFGPTFFVRFSRLWTRKHGLSATCVFRITSLTLLSAFTGRVQFKVACSCTKSYTDLRRDTWVSYSSWRRSTWSTVVVPSALHVSIDWWSRLSNCLHSAVGGRALPVTGPILLRTISRAIWLHFAWVVDDAKCIVVTRVCVCVSVCLSVRGRMPTLLHGPGCNLAEW